VTLSRTARVVTGALAVNGVLHLVKPSLYEPIMPRWVPAHREVVVWSGYAELACAAGLAVPRTRRVAALAGTGLLLGVYPANIQMALDAARGDNRALQAVSVARLPLQWPMIRAMWRTWRKA
jgi:uncharacterized membrane protein